MEDSDSILALRGYKYYPATQASGTARLYLEYAQWGDLTQLVKAYRAWDQYLPELFLWHLFLDLARAINLMRRCPSQWKDTRASGDRDEAGKKKMGAEHFILHLDLNSNNVGLGKRKRFEFDIPDKRRKVEWDHGDDTDTSEQDVPWSSRRARYESDEEPAESTEPAAPPAILKTADKKAPPKKKKKTRRNWTTKKRKPAQKKAATGKKAVYHSPQHQGEQNPVSDSEDDNDSIGDEGEFNSGDKDDLLHPHNLPSYPTAKLLDFGLAMLTSPNDEKNPQTPQNVGSPFYRAPEQRKCCSRCTPPLHRYDWANFHINEKANVWGVGFIMHDLMILSDPDDGDEIHEAIENLPATYQNTYLKKKGDGFLRHFIEGISTKKQPEYSEELRNLIWRCLRPCRSYRPSSSRLVKLVEHGLRTYLQKNFSRPKKKQKDVQTGTAVALTMEEMNRMPRGEAAFPVGPRDFHDLRVRRREWRNPDEPIAEPPRDKWEKFYNNQEGTSVMLGEVVNPKAVHDRWRDELGRKVFEGAGGTGPVKARYWDPLSQKDVDWRRRIEVMRANVPEAALDMPIDLFEYVLEKERGDEVEAARVLSWMYGGLVDPGFKWQENVRFQAQARTLLKEMKRKGLTEQTLEECLYFVVNQGRLNEVVPQAKQDMIDVFKGAKRGEESTDDGSDIGSRKLSGDTVLDEEDWECF
jgi:serine/threonine protein kinase